MQRLTGYLFLLCLLLAAPAVPAADQPDVQFSFASVPEGVRILRTRDDYVRRLSPFDRASKMKTDRTVSEEEYLDHAARSVLPWQLQERKKIDSVMRGLRPRLAVLSLQLPKTIYLVKTTGDEEGGAAYTRGNAIFIPEAMLSAPREKLAKLISHEIFHVLMRHNIDLRDRLYRVIGFEKTNEIELPPVLARRKISNPDAPRHEHRIRVRLGSEPVWVVPVLFSGSDRYDPVRGGTFFDYLQFRLLLVEDDGDRGQTRPVLRGSEPVLVGVKEVSGFFRQTGRNTGYIIHPEEILADNFALLVLGQTDVPNPEILDRMGEILRRSSRSGPGTTAGDVKPGSSSLSPRACCTNVGSVVR